MRYSLMWPKYAKWWDSMRVNASRQLMFDRVAGFAVNNSDRYKAISKATGVPWPLIAVLHRRESDADFGTYLGNGQRLDRRTTIVPKGRGPFKTFEAGAIDALNIDGLSKVKDWRLEKMLYFCETFNGWGYAYHGLPSPYVWGGTNIQRPGKYVSDGHWNRHVMDVQPGCAPILAAIKKIAHEGDGGYWMRES